MNENTNLWNKTAAELTVKDQLALAILTPAIVVGGMALAGGAITVVSKLGSMFRKSSSNVIDVKEA